MTTTRTHARTLSSARGHVLGNIIFAGFHAIPLLALWTGVRPVDIALCIGLYVVRMFFVTAGYHRYFSHRSYKTSRWFQLLLAIGAQSSAQKGALWWAAHHRHHHRHSDQEEDVHSPKKGLWFSHVGWIMGRGSEVTRVDKVKDLARYPELLWLDRHYLVPPTILALTVLALGGWSALLVGFFGSTVLLWHGTFTINSLSHVWGRRVYATTDTSRNNWLLALITLGEGWHNNHHHHQASCRQGFTWWQIDITWYALRALAAVGVVWDLRAPSARALARRRIDQGVWDSALLGPEPAPQAAEALPVAHSDETEEAA